MQSNIPPMHIGQVIRQIRETRQATLEEVAFAADMNASNLSRIERGVQGYSTETLDRIATALGTTVAELHLHAESAQETYPKTSHTKDRLRVNAFTSKYAALSLENKDLADEFLALLLKRQRAGKL